MKSRISLIGLLSIVVIIGGCVDARTTTDVSVAAATIDQYAKAIVDHPEMAAQLAPEIRKLAAAASAAVDAPLAVPPVPSVPATPAVTK